MLRYFILSDICVNFLIELLTVLSVRGGPVHVPSMRNQEKMLLVNVSVPNLCHFERHNSIQAAEHAMCHFEAS